MVRVSRGLATIKYTDRIYKPGAVSFESFKETEETQTMQYRTSELDKVHEQWQQAQGTVNAAIYKQKMALINASKVIDVDSNDPDTFDLSDIDAIFAAEGRGPRLLESEFYPCTEEPEQYINEHGEEKMKWKWCHRLTQKEFYRHQSNSGKSFDSGRLSKFLKDLKKHHHPLAFARAQHILVLNGLKQVSQDVCQSPVLQPIDRKILLAQQVRPLSQICFWFSLI